MGLFDSLFTVLQTQDSDLNRVQYNVKTAFIGLAKAVASTVDAIFDIIAYDPSLPAMKASGVLEQVYSDPTATPQVFPVDPGLIPFGASSNGVLATGNISYSSTTDTITVTHSGSHNVVDMINPDATTATQTQNMRFRRNGITEVSLQTSSAPGSAGLRNSAGFTFSATTSGIGSKFFVAGADLPIIAWLPTLDVALGQGSLLANGATNGFVWLPTMDGPPTSPATQTPTPVQGAIAVGVNTRNPVFIDRLNGRLYAWIGDTATGIGSWKSVVLT